MLVAKHTKFKIEHNKLYFPITLKNRLNKNIQGYTAYESFSYRNKFIRHRGFRLYIETDDNSNQFKKDASWKTG